MHIDYYAYGTMIVDGKSYEKDLIIFPERIIANWWRKEGHSLDVEDLKEVIEGDPEILIIGKGDSSVMQIPESTKKAIDKKGIELIEKDTHEAVKSFNELIKSDKKVVGAFHLTC